MIIFSDLVMHDFEMLGNPLLGETERKMDIYTHKINHMSLFVLVGYTSALLPPPQPWGWLYLQHRQGALGGLRSLGIELGLDKDGLEAAYKSPDTHVGQDH